jgi:hypothetical protein
VDARSGIAQAGGAERYMVLLEALRRDAQASRPLLEAVPDQGTAVAFAKAVHVLRNSLADVGAGGLSVHAEGLEKLGWAGATEAIARGLPVFRAGLAGVVSCIPGGGPAAVPGQDGAGPAAPAVKASPEARAELLSIASGLREALVAHDFPRVDEELPRFQEAGIRAGEGPAADEIADELLTANFAAALEALARLEARAKG